MSSTSLFGLLILVVVLGVNGGTCPQNIIDIARKWVDKLNVTATPDLMETIFAETCAPEMAFTIKGVGTFAPLYVASEYVRIVFPIQNSSGAWVLPQITSRHIWDACSLDCHDNILDMYNFQNSYLNNVVDSDPNWLTNLEVDYSIKVKNLRLFTRLVFNTSLTDPAARISSAFLQPERQWIRLFNARITTITDTCNLIMRVCPVNTALQQYTSFQDCFDKLSLLTPNTYCPYPTVSNTTACRNVHAQSAQIDPAVHCPHTNFLTSMTCVDSCRTDCTGCHSNAVCADAYVNITIPHYQCACNAGYAGDGLAAGTGCAQKTCTYDWQCPSGTPYGYCNQGTCACNDTLTWNPTNGTCGCLPGEILRWTASTPKCVGIGKCFDDANRYQCPQNQTRVQCKATPENPTQIFGSCICNYGYCGGYETECQCLSPKREVWSSFGTGGFNCLNSTECTEDYHCGYPKTCTTKSATTGVGLCSP